ncbi:DNA-processing protein DprA [Planktotalea arctica]|uniref:DNA-processing protein DprA n=1 Tax=Planktotalea arctica TaxID=1481893 RepID=UPI000A175FC5|nr:DNA-processing protein DprA [Planktotalea arctica]
MSEQTPSSTHPLLPPTTEDERATWLRLLRSRRVGISTFYRLLSEHGSAAAALQALPDIAAKAGLTKYQICSEQQVQSELAAAARAGAQLVCRGEAAYPNLLAEIPDAPPMLWLRGTAGALTRPMIALVGARNASSLGTRMARALSSELAEAGYVIVSGLARGIDTCAHLAAAKQGSIAVLAGGVDVIYPVENGALADSLLENGALISEQPMRMAPIARHFPMRNRIISGLCATTVVVEAAGKSGSLITARGALDQGREVLAVPGHPFDARASGCNMLIRDGASLVRGAADVISVLADIAHVGQPPSLGQMPLPLEPEPATTQNPKPSLRDMNALHQRILDRLGPSPIAEDQLLRDMGTQTSAMIPVLTDLELSGQIRRAPGGLISRT